MQYTDSYSYAWQVQFVGATIAFDGGQPLSKVRLRLAATRIEAPPGRTCAIQASFAKISNVMMQAEESSKAVVREYVDAFNRGDLGRLKSLLADDAEIQGVKGKGTFEKVEPVWRQLIEGYGIQLKIESLIAEGNTVAVRYLESGTFRNPAFGNLPTGRSYELIAMEWFEIENGKIKRRWGARDAAAQAKQLGITSA